jgi:hypothetical protein
MRNDLTAAAAGFVAAWFGRELWSEGWPELWSTHWPTFRPALRTLLALLGVN